MRYGHDRGCCACCLCVFWGWTWNYRRRVWNGDDTISSWFLHPTQNSLVVARGWDAGRITLGGCSGCSHCRKLCIFHGDWCLRYVVDCVIRSIELFKLATVLVAIQVSPVLRCRLSYEISTPAYYLATATNKVNEAFDLYDSMVTNVVKCIRRGAATLGHGKHLEEVRTVTKHLERNRTLVNGNLMDPQEVCRVEYFQLFIFASHTLVNALRQTVVATVEHAQCNVSE